MILLLVRFIHGIGFGATMNTVMLIGMAGLPKSRYAEAAGYLMMSASLGVAIGPFCGGLIYDSLGGSGCFIAASIFSMIVLVAIVMLDTKEIDPWYKNQGIQKSNIREPFSLNQFIEVKVVPISLCIFCLCFGYAAMLLVSRPMAGKIQDKWGDNAICYPCILAQVIGIVLLAWKPCMLTIVICALCGALGYGTLNSTLNVIVNRQVSDERRSFAVSTYWAFSDFGVGIAPAILGAIATATNYHILYYVAAGISFIALPIYWIAWGKKKH